MILPVGVTVVMALAFPSTASATRLEFACEAPLPADAVDDIVRLSDSGIASVQLRKNGGTCDCLP
ncbi:hypothetical protein ACLMAJ_12760 [Nocardia sp. KC 131]|uniref:hypothetical protein n=1 Tax=Nocardia arseniciresistens TaxID=3392119 RepID=UPI00398F2D94